jgi:glycerophosphoryl diester phosphodiesterase
VAKIIKYSLVALFNREDIVAVNIEILRKHPGLLKKMRAKKIYVWTVNSHQDLRWLAKRDINGVITDRVKRAKKVLTL